jgi:hypothetical protein
MDLPFSTEDLLLIRKARKKNACLQDTRKKGGKQGDLCHFYNALLGKNLTNLQCRPYKDITAQRREAAKRRAGRPEGLKCTCEKGLTAG